MTLGQAVIGDYFSLRLSLRESLPHDQLAKATGRVTVTGLVITRQRPDAASGVVFLTLEGETGTANIVVWKKGHEAFRKAVIAGRLVRVTGRIERKGAVTHVIAVEDVSHLLATLGRPMIGADPRPAADKTHPARGRIRLTAGHPREQARKLFPSRDFH